MGAFYRRLSARVGKAKAVTATARKIAVLFYNTLRHGMEYRGLWFIPLTCLLASVALSFGTIAIDQASDYNLVPQWLSGGPDAAIEIFGPIAASMVASRRLC
ncbi:DUF2254 family protein [Sinorhizobium psoraleae]|uniref:DUF2254 family protein n=1 Tax=Sinorhizobium psoraleae TaxID=520838 RepID=UPI001569A633|nr:hypothetical protein [Sinorhizobium psoraleae]